MLGAMMCPPHLAILEETDEVLHIAARADVVASDAGHPVEDLRGQLRVVLAVDLLLSLGGNARLLCTHFVGHVVFKDCELNDLARN